MPFAPLIYILIGVVLHLIVLGSTFVTSSLWSWMLVFLWPAPVFTAIGIFGLVVFLLVTGVLALIDLWDAFRGRKTV